MNEWAYAIPFQTPDERNRWLPRYLGLYDGRRCHMALGGLSRSVAAQPAAQLNDLVRKHTYRALADGQVDLIADDSTNGLTPTLKLQRLEDDRQYFPPLRRRAGVQRSQPATPSGIFPIVENLAGRLSAATMQGLNAEVDLRSRTPEDVERCWREAADWGAKPGPLSRP